jgi:hypothetical protein
MRADAGEPRRPPWMTALALFCLATVVFLAARDLFVAHTRDVEVWLGVELRGRAALLTAPVHWAVFGAGAWGFWRQRPWILPAASAYLFYVALSHLVWNRTSPHGGGWIAGAVEAALISIPAAWLLRAHRAARRRR